MTTGDDSQRAVQAEYAELADSYDSRWSSYLASTIAETCRRVRIRPGEQVLDVGCGTGWLLAELSQQAPGARYTGVDLSLSMLCKAAQRIRRPVVLAVGDAQRLPFADRSFDVVVSTSSFHFWPKPLLALQELARVLRPAGRVVITDWCDDYLACRFCDLVLRIASPAHRRTYGRRECEQMLAQAGFRVRQVDRYRINWLWGMMTAVAQLPAEAG